MTISSMATEVKGIVRFTQFYRTLLQNVDAGMDKRGLDEVAKQLSTEIRIEDVGVSILVAGVLLVSRILFEKKVRSSWKKASVRTQKRLSENMFYTIYYTLAFAFYVFGVRPSVDWGVSLFSNKNNIVPVIMVPYPPPMNFFERAYYVQSFGYYISAMIFLVVFDPRRSDFNELFLHHFVTIGLVVGSYLFGYVRVGIIVLALHDIGDIFLYGAKALHYMGLAGLDTAVFAVFAVTFFVTRLVMYSRLVYAISVESLISVSEVPELCGWGTFFETYFWHHLFFAIFLSTLLVLHTFWFALILRMIHRELFLGKKVSDEGDIRSDSDDD